MSPNHADLDEAIEDLKGEVATGEQRARAARAVSRPKQIGYRVPTLAVSVCALTAAFLLFPSKRTTTLAFGDVVKRSADAIAWHSVWVDEADRRRGEAWRSGDGYAFLEFDPEGKVMFESRRDNLTDYLYFDSSVRNYTVRLPNQYSFAFLMNISNTAKRYEPGHNTIKELLDGKRAKLVRQESAELDGKPVEKYVVTNFGEQMTFYADPSSGRIVELQSKNNLEKYDYPESIDPKTFSWKYRITKDAPIQDQRNLSMDTPFKMPKPLASKDGVALRMVHLDPSGSLQVWWTGALFSRKHTKPFTIVGVKTGKPWFPPGPITDRNKLINDLTGVNLPPLEKIGSKITVRIPTAVHKYVEFKDVPVSRMQPIK